MGLRTIHVVFVTVASLSAFVFGGWSWRYAEVEQSGLWRLIAAASFGLGAALVAYGFWFWRKIDAQGLSRNGGRAAVALLVLASGLLLQPAAEACTVCYGEAEGPLIDGARAGVWLLWGLVLGVQCAFVGFFVYLWRRGRKFGEVVVPTEEINES